MKSVEKLEELKKLLNSTNGVLMDFMSNSEFKKNYTIMMESLNSLIEDINFGTSVDYYSIDFINRFLEFEYPVYFYHIPSKNYSVQKRKKCAIYQDFKTVVFLEKIFEYDENYKRVENPVCVDIYELDKSYNVIHTKMLYKQDEWVVENKVKKDIMNRKKALKR